MNNRFLVGALSVFLAVLSTGFLPIDVLDSSAPSRKPAFRGPIQENSTALGYYYLLKGSWGGDYDNPNITGWYGESQEYNDTMAVVVTPQDFVRVRQVEVQFGANNIAHSWGVFLAEYNP
jgi:hypothetical protein